MTNEHAKSNAREGDGVAEYSRVMRNLEREYPMDARVIAAYVGALEEGICRLTAMLAQQGAEPVAFPLYEFVSLLMCSDPWPVDDAGYGTGQDALVALADRESQRQGFTDWIDAIHQLKAPATGAPR